GRELGDGAAAGRERLRTRVERERVDLDAGRDAAQAVRRLEHEHPVAATGEVVRDRQPRRPGAGDDRVPRPVLGRVGLRATRHRVGHRACTASTIRVSTAGSVEGGTPWPRLNTCARATEPASMTWSIAASIVSHGAPSTAGSRLPCTVTS